jgi:hypothetical protein
METQEVNKLPIQPQTPLRAIDRMTLELKEKHRKIAEEALHRYSQPVVKRTTPFVLPSIEEEEQRIIQWNKNHPTYYEDLYKAEFLDYMSTVHVTPNGKYVIHPDFVEEMTDEQRANMETDPEIINSYYDHL